MLNKAKNKMQKLIDVLTVFTSGFMLLGICGSLEVDKIGFKAFMFQSLVVVIISFITYLIATYVNKEVSYYLISKYRNNNKYKDMNFSL